MSAKQWGHGYHAGYNKGLQESAVAPLEDKWVKFFNKFRQDIDSYKILRQICSISNIKSVDAKKLFIEIEEEYRRNFVS